MKYMGSKRAMLTNGLGELIDDVAAGRGRFVDMFTGSAAVAKFVAARHAVPVVALDLQRYAATLAGAVLHRVAAVNTGDAWQGWLVRASTYLAEHQDLLGYAEALDVCYQRGISSHLYARNVRATRAAAGVAPAQLTLTRAYGGHYFGLRQALWLDALRITVPEGGLQELAIAALVEAASECSASPGHTAQPFAPTKAGIPHLFGAWSRDIVDRTAQRFAAMGLLHARVQGHACVGDAVHETQNLTEIDLVFIDPPYSEVQYSRFYHVLEGVAVGWVDDVEGVGRYPPIRLRPQSNFSRKAPAVEEFELLMKGVAQAGAHALVTFPEHEASNGLSGKLVEEISAQYFDVVRRAVKSTFSTLGGTGTTRDARQGTTELILHLVPR